MTRFGPITERDVDIADFAQQTALIAIEQLAKESGLPAILIVTNLLARPADMRRAALRLRMEAMSYPVKEAAS